MIKWQICNNLKVTMSLCLNDPGNNTISWNGCHDLSWVQLLHVQIYVCVQCTCILWLCPHEFCMSMSDMYCFALVCVYIYVYIIYIFYIQQIWIYIAIHIYIYIYMYLYGNKHPKIKFFERKKAPIPLFHAFFSAFHRVILSLESTSNLQLVGSALEDALPQPSRENAHSGCPNKMGQIWFLTAQHVTIEMAVSTMVGVIVHFLQVRL